MYEWTYGEPPISIEEPEIQFNTEEDESKEQKVKDLINNNSFKI